MEECWLLLFVNYFYILDEYEEYLKKRGEQGMYEYNYGFLI